MILDPAVARNSMAKMMLDAWAAADWAAYGIASAPRIEWQGRGGDQQQSPELPYAIWNARHSDESQAGMSDERGNQLWEPIGLIVVQCKGPLINGDGFEVAERMAIIARNAYRGKQTPDCIWFRNARIEEVGPDAGWFLFNAYIEFEYNEVG